MDQTCMCEDDIHDEPRDGCDNPATSSGLFQGTRIPLCQPCLDRGCMGGADTPPGV
jgi:hypothetical protein